MGYVHAQHTSHCYYQMIMRSSEHININLWFVLYPELLSELLFIGD